jgi:hypothetical protein
VWNLGEASSCAPPPPGTAPTGRGRGGRGGGGTWVRALPGAYTVTLGVAGQTLQQPVTVRMDPRVKSSEQEMRAWHREARVVERTECTLDRANADLAGIDRQLTDLESKATDAAARDRIAALRAELRPVVLALRGDPRDPGHVNLPGRVNWLTIQVGNYSGKPTAAQSEWIAEYAKQTDAIVAKLETLKQKIQGVQ